MAFWGVEIKPNKPYLLDGVGGRLHISKATLGDGTSSKKTFVQCTVGDKSPVRLCCLKPDQTDSVSLHVEFSEYDEVSFEVVGNSSVHLVGYYLDKGANFDGDADDSSDSYGEDIGESDSEQSSDFDTDDEYGGEFIDDDAFEFIGDEDDDDDTEMFSPSPKRNSGVIIEEIEDDEKPTNGNVDGKRIKKKNQVSDSDDEKQIIASGGTSIFESESEDEDGLPIPRSKTKDKIVEKQNKHEKKASKGNKKKADDAVVQVVGSKRKSEDSETKRGIEEPSKVPSSQNGQETVAKPNKKKKKEAKTEEVKTDATKEEPLGEEASKKLSNDSVEIVATEDTSGKKKKKKKKNKKNKTEDSIDESKKDSVAEVEEKQKEEAKPTQERTYANGLVVEELEMGKPDAKRANPGKKVSLCYIGKLKKNGKIFDSCTNRKSPFQFRLGIGQVIKGWDVGVSGMRVGDKRRLTIPPSMGYGARGAAPAIPPNAWLVFDVELIATQ